MIQQYVEAFGWRQAYAGIGGICLLTILPLSLLLRRRPVAVAPGASPSLRLLAWQWEGWILGAIYDLTLSYDAAFLNGFLWNLLSMAIATYLLMRLGPQRRARAGFPVT